MTEKENETEILNIDEKALIRGNDFLHALQPYGEVKLVREMSRRIQALDKSKIKLNGGEAAHLAQLAISHDLNPFSGEIWGWITIKNGERHFSWMPGRSGLKRHADRQAKEGEFHWWTDEVELTTHEKKTLMIPEDALAFESKCFDSATMDPWRETFTLLVADIGVEEALKILGNPPCSVGIGVLTQFEISRMPKNNKMPHVNRCKKRARTEAIKNRFSLSFGGSAGGGGQTFEEYIVDSEGAIDVDFEDVIEGSPSGLPEELFGKSEERMDPKFWKGICETMVKKELAQDAFVAAELLAYSTFTPRELNEEWALRYFKHAKEILAEDIKQELKDIAPVAYARLFETAAQKKERLAKGKKKPQAKKTATKKAEVKLDDKGLNARQKESLKAMAADFPRYTPKSNQDWETANKYIDLKKVTTSRTEFRKIVKNMGGDVRLGMCRMLGYL